MVIRRKHLAGLALGGLLLGGALMALVAGMGSPSIHDRRIVDAAEKQDMATVRSLLEQGVDSNSTQPNGATALHWAVRWNDIATAEVLIGQDANVNVVNETGTSPLMLACTNGNATMVQSLLDARANANLASPSGDTPLMRCARSGLAGAVKTLLAHGAQVNAKDNERGQTALMWAIAEKQPKAARALMEGDADIHARSKNGLDALMIASRVGDTSSAALLIASSANVNTHAPNGMTPLLFAAASGQEDVAVLLLEKGADPNARDEYGATALHYALTKGLAALTGVRFTHDLSVLFRPSQQQLVEALLARGANPNVQLEKAPPFGGSGSKAAIGATPFLLAAASPDVTVMRMLANAGADPKTPTRTGLTPLMVAAGAGRGQIFSEDEKAIALEAVQLAVELGDDVAAADEDGLTALHGAAANGVDAMVEFLVAKGASVDVRDKYQQTPLSVAAGKRLPWIPEGAGLGKIIQPSTRDLLLELGATPLDAPGYFHPSEESGYGPQSQP